MKLKNNEIRDLFITVVTLGVIFSLRNFTVENIAISLFAVGIAFLFHELAHRESASKFGAYAEYKVWPTGLLIALVLGVLSQGRIIFAAPGAVYISALKTGRWKSEFSKVSNEECGIISLSGPLVNLALSVVFLALNHVYPWSVFVAATSINIFIAFFNLLPVQPFDGYKVMRWCRKTWLVFFLTSLVGLLGMWFL